MHGFFHRYADPDSFPRHSLLCYDYGCLTFSFFGPRLFWFYLQSRFADSETRLPMSGAGGGVCAR